jgi:outer membrane protein OmpA-like peptidoglycan-associated protein
MSARFTSFLLVLCFVGIKPLKLWAQKTDTATVLFPFNVASLTGASERTLDSLVYACFLQPGKPVAIIGYADYVGRTSYNDTLSYKRALSVKTFLLRSGFRSQDIEVLLAKGEVQRDSIAGREGFAPDRKVNIVIKLPPAIQSAWQRTRPKDTIPRKTFTATFEAPRNLPLKGVLQEPKTGSNNALKPQTKKPIPTRVTAGALTELLKIDTGTTIQIKNLYFPTGRHTPYETSLPELDRLYLTLKENPRLRVRIEGHVCCINPTVVPDALDEETNEFHLSVNRARFIVSYLVKKGIPERQLEFSGYGKSRPVVPIELTDEDGERNRRVEVRVLSR